MQFVYFWLVFVLLLPASAIAHDVYLFYLAQETAALDLTLIDKILTEERPARKFNFAAIGFLWLEYSPETYRSLKESMTPENWEFLQQFLKLKIFFVSAGITILSYVLFAIFMVMRYTKAASSKSYHAAASLRPSAQRGKGIKYKRR